MLWSVARVRLLFGIQLTRRCIAISMTNVHALPFRVASLRSDSCFDNKINNEFYIDEIYVKLIRNTQNCKVFNIRLVWIKRIGPVSVTCSPSYMSKRRMNSNCQSVAVLQRNCLTINHIVLEMRVQIANWFTPTLSTNAMRHVALRGHCWDYSPGALP